MARLVLVAAVAAVTAAATTAHADTVEGTVFFDRDGDGLLSAGDDPVPGVVVGWDHTDATTTAADGRFAFTRPRGAQAIVWASVPEGGVPGPAWAAVEVTAAEVTVDIAVRPLPPAAAAAPATFVVLADSHMDGIERAWLPAHLAAALDQALALDPPPRFFTILGDVTQANRPEDFAATDEALAGVDVPWVPVPGNHDWYDGGDAYRARWGPDSYSFTTGGVHVIVWNSQLSPADVTAFVRRDLAGVDPDVPVIALGHIPPRDAVAAALRDAGVDALFTGHWHANRVVDHGGLREYGTQAIVFGGIDLTPAGYRVVHVEDGGALRIVHHSVVAAPVVRVAWPPPTRCVPDGADLLAAVEVGAGIRAVTATIADDTLALEPVGGWIWRAPLPALPPGDHEVHVVAHTARGVVDHRATIAACSPRPPRSVRLGVWPQHQGGPEHHGAVATGPAPALATLWATPVGGHLLLGAPVVDDGVVVAAVNDLGGGGGGGIAALDLVTGAPRWWFPTALPARHSPAVAAGVAIVATTDGRVWGVDLHTGLPRWTHDLGDGADAVSSALWAPPVVRDGIAYVNVQRRLAAIEAATGAIQWTAVASPQDDSSSSCSAMAVTDELVIGVVHRNSGIAAWRRADGQEVWRVVEPVIGVHGAIVADAGTVWVGTVRGEVVALDAATGAERWRRVATAGHDWSYAIGGSPALAGGTLVVPTTWERLVALDAATGAERWALAGAPGPLHTAHYRAAIPGWLASPVIAGDLVWAPDTSGRLRALDLATGAERWQVELGAPALGGLAVTGDLLLVTTWDGVVRALAPAALVPGTPEERRATVSGCCASRTTAGGATLIAALALIAVSVTRRSRRA